MDDSDEDANNFIVMTHDSEIQNDSGRPNRRRSADTEVSPSDSRTSDKRRYSCGSLNDSRDQGRQSFRGSSNLSDIREWKSQSLHRLNQNSKERKYTLEEKRSAWSKGRNDSGILTSYDSSRFSSTNNISSIDALLDERTVNAEEVLTNLGFAPTYGNVKLEHRIPQRFLRANSRSKGIQIERFVNSNPNEFQDLLSRRRLLQWHHPSVDDGNAVRHCDCDSNDGSSDAGSYCANDSRRCSSPRCCREGPQRMINNESVMRLMNSGLPSRFMASLNQRISTYSSK